MTQPDASDSLLARAAQRQRQSPIRMPVAVIGPRQATPAQYAAAEAVGPALPRWGWR